MHDSWPCLWTPVSFLTPVLQGLVTPTLETICLHYLFIKQVLLTTLKLKKYFLKSLWQIASLATFCIPWLCPIISLHLLFCFISPITACQGIKVLGLQISICQGNNNVSLKTVYCGRFNLQTIMAHFFFFFHLGAGGDRLIHWLFIFTLLFSSKLAYTFWP